MGDVAMMLPVLYATARANPQHEFTLLTQPFLTSLLLNPPANLEAMAIDIRREERSVWGLMRYVERLRGERFDYLVDLHSVLRTWVLRLGTCLMSRTRCIGLRKPRAARARLLSRSERDLSPIVPMCKLYADALRCADLAVPELIPPIELGEVSSFHRAALAVYFEDDSQVYRVGIAPFASTESKTYDLQLMKQLLELLCADTRYRVYLFGGRADAEQLEAWSADCGAISLAGKLGLQDELYAISQLDVMLSMDSANAHLAAMVGVPVVSLWCCTHPSAGFAPMGQPAEYGLQPEGIPCRPCSIFGKVRRCELGDMPCRRGIEVERVLRAIGDLTSTSR